MVRPPRTFLQKLALGQDDPQQFLADLRGVKRDHEQRETPDEQRRFELRLELDEGDLDCAITEIEAVLDEL